MTDHEAPTEERSPGRGSQRDRRRADFRRAIGLTALGTVLPGAGLTQTRNRRLGWVLLGVTLVGIVVLTYLVLTKGLTDTALGVVSRSSNLQLLVVGFVVVGVLWCASIVLTAVRARPRRLDRSHTRWLAAFTTVMVLVIATFSYKAAEYATITKDTVAGIFTGTNDTTGGPDLDPDEGEDPWANTPRVNILLLGSDAGVDRTGTRTDSMVVASIDTKTGRTALVSLPRNLMKAPLPKSSPLNEIFPGGVYGEVNGTPSCPTDGENGCLLNSVWTVTDLFKQSHPDAFPGEAVPGRDQTRDIISEILGLRIDHTVVIDLKGFEQLIDAMGGLDVNVKLSGNDTKLPIGGHLNEVTGRMEGTVLGYFEPGRQHLDGSRALWYARTRAADSDSYRQARQRCVVQAIVQQVNPASMVAKYADIARIAKDNIYTDVSADSLPAYVELVQRVQQAKITSVALTSTQKIYSGNPDYDRVRALVKKAITTPPAPKPSPSTSSGSSSGSPSTPTGSATAPSGSATTELTPEQKAEAYNAC
ncbi:LCP family protein [Terracoccus luteus]|uniref:LCP family protein required for cell wall assembly n=1 Tax=Terracoccus luteus TaxID=53356 RepID=A0A839PSD2_9MICO|nr:LCP family protein [Terracoccus luteus]MBB2986437.1 LCP family protein required for cell wall assembly [Terracoccus luteus]MCP2171974.1 LCP family protein required for cell wall assembly [Terracoccus luteus]